MSWLPLAGPLAIALGLLLLPGVVVALASGLRGFAVVAVAPALSTTAIAMGAVLGGLVGLPWGWWTAVLATVLMTAIAWPLARLAGAHWSGPTIPTRSWRDDLPAWGGFLLAAGLMARHVRNVLDRPDAFSQTFDNIFHLSAIRYILDTGDASSLTMGQLTSNEQPFAFYPAAFHDAASLVTELSGVHLVVGTNALLVVLVAVAWPLSCLAFIRRLVASTWPTMLGAGVLIASFAAFPVLMLNFGVLYPNLYGLCLLPVLIALNADALGLARHPRATRGLAVLLGLMVLPALALSHPNTLMTWVAVTVVMSIPATFRGISAHRADGGGFGGVLLRLVGLVATLAVARLLWAVVRPPEEAATWPPTLTPATAIGQAILNAPVDLGVAWLPSILMVIGMVVAARSGLGWLVLAWAGLTALWLIVAAGEAGPERMFATGIWYNDSIRFSAVLPLLSLPLAAVGLSSLADQTEGALSRRLPRGRPAIAIALAVVVPAIAIAGTQRAAYMDAGVEAASSLYSLNPLSPVVTTDEYALLMRLPRHVPADGVIATNPWNGSSMAYPLVGIRTTTTHVLFDESPEQAVLREALDEAATVPSVCPAVQDLGAGWVLDFGTQEVNRGHNPYPGFLDLATARGFEEVDRQGQAVLYRITACG